MPSLTPLTPDGLATGPGVDGTSITLGVLVDPAVDRGFTEGLALWQRSANDTGGICGRSITLRVAGSGDVPAALPAAYRAIGRHVLGLITLPDPDDTAAVDAMIGADQIPALTPLGTSAQLAAPGPIVIGPTADIVGINTFAYLDKAGLMPDRTLGVLSDGSAMAADALNGLRWAAGLANVTLTVLSTSDASPANWGSVRAVVSLAGPADTDRLLAATGSDITVMTSVDGYEPTGLQTGWAARLLVATPTPAFGSDHPAATAAAKAFTAAGGTDPGPRLLTGYATGTAWGRLLAKACSDLSLTRSGVDTALTEIGPAAVDSLLGPSDPGVVVSKHLPATRLSAVAQADPTAPAGLKPLTWLEAAPNIANYIPTT